MDNITRNSAVVPIRAHLAGIEVVGNLEGESTSKRRDHFVIVSIDEQEIIKSDKMSRQPTPRWKLPEDHQFRFHPSSTIKITLYRESRTRITKHLVGQHTGKVAELLDNDATIDLKDKEGAGISSGTKIKISLSLVPEPEGSFKSFMKSVDDDVSRLESALAQAGTPALDMLNRALQLTKNVMDIVAGTHPVLRASWTILSAVYTAVQQAELLDDAVRALAKNLGETLGIAEEKPDLLLIEGTDNVIEEIGRTSLEVASLIREYTRLRFAGRVMKYQIFDDMKLHIAQCQKSCDELKEKFDRRVNVETNRLLKTIKDDQLADKIYRWLSAPDSSKNYHDARKKHQEDTCSWFLDGERFRKFQERAEFDFLWIKGKAGSGKTILCSSIIDKIATLCKENTLTTFAYFFFDGRDAQKDLQLHDKLIRSLILQLSRQCEGNRIPAALVELYGGGYQQPSTEALEDILYHIVAGMPSVYIIIDSLDECTERQEILEWIKGIVARKITTLHMAVVSRPEQDIENALRLLDAHCVDLAESSTNHDITKYLDQELSVLEKRWDEQTRDIVKSTLTKNADGMYESFYYQFKLCGIVIHHFSRFRWVALQLMELKKCSTPNAVREQLNTLPKGLYETYDRILLKIDDQTARTDTTTFLRWLCFSVRPMKLVEIAEAAAVVFDTENSPRYSSEHRYWDKSDVLEKCAGLVTESNESQGAIKLAHFSIKEYLLSEHLQRTQAISSFYLTSDKYSHSLISQTCLTYLLQFDAPTSVDSNVTTSFPLALYTAEHWVFHAQSGGIDDPEPSLMLTLAQRLLTPNSATLTNWVRLWDCDDQQASSLQVKRPHLQKTDFCPALYYTSLMGLYRVSLHLSKEVDINERGGLYNTALHAASARGHVAIVELLLAEGADVNAQGGLFSHALKAASTGGHVAIVKRLLAKGADVNARGGMTGYALHVASVQGNDAIIKLLLANGADVNAQGGLFRNALSSASIMGHVTTVELLLANGADVHTQGGHYGNALQGASAGGYDAIVALLLAKGADVNAQGGDYGNALQVASARGHRTTVVLLLAKGADVNAQGGKYGNALQAASHSGHHVVVVLLLAKGANVNAQGGDYGNALQAASAAGHSAVVMLLLETGADVNAQGGHYGNALHAASAGGYDAIVDLLLAEGADVNAQGGYYGNALQAASVREHNAIVDLLLAEGADVNAQGGHYGNALQAASAQGHITIVELLLTKGADVHAQGGRYGNALQAGAAAGYVEIVELLLAKGANVNAQGGYIGNALQAASSQGHAAMVELLLTKGANVNAQGGGLGNALQAASSQGHDAIAELLLAKGADVHAQGGYYGNALQGASAGGHNKIVELLLVNGADMNAQEGHYGNALQAASTRGHIGVVELLLAKGADVNAQGGEHGNALQGALDERHDTIVELLLANGAENTIPP